MRDVKFIVLLILIGLLFAMTFTWLKGLQTSVNWINSKETLFSAKRITVREVFIVNDEYQRVMCLSSFPDGRPYVVIQDANHSAYTNIGAGWIDHEKGN